MAIWSPSQLCFGIARSPRRPPARLSCLSDTRQSALTSDASCFVQRRPSAAFIPLDAAAPSPRAGARSARADNALHSGPSKPAEQSSRGCWGPSKSQGVGRSGFQRGHTAGIARRRREGLELVPLLLRPGPVLTPLAGTEAPTPQRCRVVRGSTERGLRRGNPPCQRRPSPGPGGRSSHINKTWLFRRH